MKIFKNLIAALAAFALLAANAATTVPVQLLNPAGSSAGQAIVSTGTSSAPAWGSVSATSLASIAANSVLANVTGSAASPTAFAMPSCSTVSDALWYASGTGFTCNTAINATSLGGATFGAPGAIGSTTPGSGAFTSLSATGTVSNIGLIGIQVFTVSGTYTADAHTQSIVVEVQAQGGGGGGCASTTSTQNCVAGSGQAGSYAKVYYTGSFTPETVTIGTTGAGGSAGGNTGTGGGAASFGTLVSCPGGNPGGGGSATTATTVVVGGVTGVASTCTVTGGTTVTSFRGPVPSLSQSLGVLGINFTAPGGNSPLGSGGSLILGTSNGINAQGFGAGGSGGASSNGAATAGGNPSGGEVIIYEFN